MSECFVLDIEYLQYEVVPISLVDLEDVPSYKFVDQVLPKFGSCITQSVPIWSALTLRLSRISIIPSMFFSLKFCSSFCLCSMMID